MWAQEGSATPPILYLMLPTDTNQNMTSPIIRTVQIHKHVDHK